MDNDTLTLVMPAVGTALLATGSVLIMSLQGGPARTRAQAIRFLLGLVCVLVAAFLYNLSSWLSGPPWGVMPILGLVLLVLTTGYVIVRARGLMRTVRQEEQPDARDLS